MNQDTLVGLYGAIAGILLAWIGFKKNKQDATTKFQDSLIKRVETLELDNESLRQRNEELLEVNLKERQKQFELEQKIERMETEKLKMLDRIQDLEQVVEKLTKQMNLLKKEGL
jgi:hypothetical protein